MSVCVFVGVAVVAVHTGGRLGRGIRKKSILHAAHILASDCKDSITVIIVVGLHGHTGGHFELTTF